MNSLVYWLIFIIYCMSVSIITVNDLRAVPCLAMCMHILVHMHRLRTNQGQHTSPWCYVLSRLKFPLLQKKKTTFFVYLKLVNQAFHRLYPEGDVRGLCYVDCVYLISHLSVASIHLSFMAIGMSSQNMQTSDS